MAFNPLDEKGIPLEQQFRSWSQLNVEPYNKRRVHPYTRTRIILMNGIEVEAALFLHQFARHTTDPELKQQLAAARRLEQQQQKVVNWLIPADESTLEVTIGYEQVAVDLTAYLARTEPDPYVKAALDFALLEDFDHLYRYANLLDTADGRRAEDIVGDLTEIMPGRPTAEEHRHPFDSVRKHYDRNTADILTKLHCMTITAGEQQTMNFYMNVGNRPMDTIGRGLYLEIGQIEEQHVSHYESLIDPEETWLEHLVMYNYNEAYLYYGFMTQESDPRIKSIWEQHLNFEIGHLHSAIELMKKHEKRDPTEKMLPKEFPELTLFESSKDYIRDVLRNQVDLTAHGTEFIPVDKLPKDNRYHKFQGIVNAGPMVPSRDVITEHVDNTGREYRLQTEGPHPVERLLMPERARAMQEH